MTPEEPGSPIPADVAPPPAPAPSPEPTPEAASAPDPTPAAPDSPPDERTVPQDSLWRSMFDRVAAPEPRPSLPEQIAAVEGRAPATPRERAPRPAVPAPGPPAPSTAVDRAARAWADKYDTPEALESAYREAETALQRAEAERQSARSHAERMERLLYATMQGQPGQPGQPAQPGPTAPPIPQQLDQALELVRQEHEKLALSDPEGSPLRLVRALAVASRLDQEARQHYADTALREVYSRANAQQQIQSVQDEFFTQYPDLRRAEPDLLRTVAIRTEANLRARRHDYGSAAYMQQWFTDTANLARRSIRLEDGQGATPPVTTAAPTTPAPQRSTSAGPRAPRQAQGAPFAETPTPRAVEPTLTGQDVHLARIFGPGR